jgi:hypothetical protein
MSWTLLEGAREGEVVDCLRYLRNERGLRPGTKNGPRHFSWFKTVVADYFRQKREHDFVINPSQFCASQSDPAGLSDEEFAAMTAPLE